MTSVEQERSLGIGCPLEVGTVAWSEHWRGCELRLREVQPRDVRACAPPDRLCGSHNSRESSLLADGSIYDTTQIDQVQNRGVKHSSVHLTSIFYCYF